MNGAINSGRRLRMLIEVGVWDERPVREQQ